MYCSVCVCVCVCVCVYTNVPVMMRLQEVHGNDQDQPLIPWWDEGPVKGPERKGGGALGLLERLTVCGDADGGPGRGAASVGTGLLRLGERAGESPRWVNGHWGTSRGGPESQARRSPGPSPPLLLQSKDQKMVGDITGAQSHASTAKCLNVWALVLGLLLTITFITVFGTGSGPRFSLRVRVSHSKEAAVAVRGRHRVLGGRSRLRPSGGGPGPAPPPLPPPVSLTSQSHHEKPPETQLKAGEFSEVH